MKQKKTPVYWGEPMKRLIDRMKPDQTVSGRINQIIDRYLSIIDSDSPGAKAEEIAKVEQEEN